MNKVQTIDDLNAAKKRGLERLLPQKTKILVGMATSGIASGAGAVYDALAQEIQKRDLDIILTKTGSMGFDSMEPLIDVIEPGKPRLSFAKVTVKKVLAILDQLMEGTIELERPFYRMDEEEGVERGEKIRYLQGEIPPYLKNVPVIKEIDFYRKQLKLATRNCGNIDPESIDEYIAKGGYFSLYKAVTNMAPEAVIDDVIKSGLRGRGGAGFTAGVKWRNCRAAHGDIKYVICNGDEGDPGAYMDRSLMEGDPHSVIEGMMIGAYAIGAREGYIYVRNEYPLAVANLQKAIDSARDYGFLGKDIFGKGFDFNIKISQGAGAFVCGESTALMASLEGRAGEPRAKYIHTVEHGLWDRPSNLNNVETWSNVPMIIDKGGSWFAGIGRPTSTGTKVFSLVGKIKNIGLVEVPMGTSLREIVFEMGGGIPDGGELKAVQTGGPSGGCIPASLTDIPVDFDELSRVGSVMGSGGMIVMDNHSCMVDIARYFIEFLESEACGKCVPCREGVHRMRQILQDITEGRGEEGDIELLEFMSSAIIDGSLCGLGGTAPNPVLSTIRYYRDEYEAHIRDKKCPAGVCKPLIYFRINPAKCNGCGRCSKVCPTGSARGERKQPFTIDQETCIKCGACVESCKFGAITIQ